MLRIVQQPLLGRYLSTISTSSSSSPSIKPVNFNPLSIKSKSTTKQTTSTPSSSSPKLPPVIASTRAQRSLEIALKAKAQIEAKIALISAKVVKEMNVNLEKSSPRIAASSKSTAPIVVKRGRNKKVQPVVVAVKGSKFIPPPQSFVAYSRGEFF